MEDWKIKVSTRVIWKAKSFNNLEGMSSGPVALCASRLASKL